MKQKGKAKHKVSGLEARTLSLPPNYTAQYFAPRKKEIKRWEAISASIVERT